MKLAKEKELSQVLLSHDLAFNLNDTMTAIEAEEQKRLEADFAN